MFSLPRSRALNSQCIANGIVIHSRGYANTVSVWQSRSVIFGKGTGTRVGLPIYKRKMITRACRYPTVNDDRVFAIVKQMVADRLLVLDRR